MFVRLIPRRRKNGTEDAAGRGSHIAKFLDEPIIGREKISVALAMYKRAARHDLRRTTAKKKHNHASDDRLIQYRGGYSRHCPGQALTNLASDRRTGVTCLKPSRRAVEPLSLLVCLSSS
jgi:hypothetical protein